MPVGAQVEAGQLIGNVGMSEPLDWMPAAIGPVTPSAVMAVPASGRTDLRGRRLLIGLPGFGWRGDLRGDAAIVQASRTYVPVLPEHEWYRAEAEQIEVFAPLVPIDRVWVETVEAPGTTPDSQPRDIVERLVSLDAPPRRDPIPVRDMPALTGRRLVQADPAAALRDLRAVTEPYQNTDGRHLRAGLHPSSSGIDGVGAASRHEPARSRSTCSGPNDSADSGVAPQTHQSPDCHSSE